MKPSETLINSFLALKCKYVHRVRGVRCSRTCGEKRLGRPSKELLEMTLVYSDASDAPGLHALVVGVGSYTDGVGADTNSLRSAPNSAVAMANWLRNEYRSA